MGQPASRVRKGVGLNSIPVRFALMSAVFTVIVATVTALVLTPRPGAPPSAAWLALAALALGVPPLVNFLAANKLAGMIRALQTSTHALASGDFSRPVDIDCACEVGSLADGFRAMVARLNSNILRMNVLAYTDAITGLPNRAVISHVMSLARSAGPENCAGSMMFIDLDGFKRVNDTIGHDAGDELLRQVAQRIIQVGLGLKDDELDTCTTAFGELCQTCPTKPVFARFAGDEFVALLPGMHDENDLRQIAERVIAALAAPFRVFDNDLFIGASIGVARMPADTLDPEQLLTYSDIAMYKAKESGKNGYAFFDASLRSRVEERSLIERELQKAILADDLQLHYQPKVDTRTHELTGVEALVRWNCPGLGPVSPEVFIPIAEQCGLMASLGESILRLAVRQARDWARAGEPLRIAVNVSPVQFERPGLVEMVLTALAESGLDPDLLELEITESIAMADFANTRQRIDDLRAAGVRISIDDFGTGYSNLSQLARLNFDALKIDRSLIMGVGENGKSESMLSAIVSMAHALGHKAIAEGVETPEQMSFLRSLGCDALQGYLIARPMPSAALNEWRDARGDSPARRLMDTLSLASA